MAAGPLRCPVTPVVTTSQEQGATLCGWASPRVTGCSSPRHNLASAADRQAPRGCREAGRRRGIKCLGQRPAHASRRLTDSGGRPPSRSVCPCTCALAPPTCGAASAFPAGRGPRLPPHPHGLSPLPWAVVLGQIEPNAMPSLSVFSEASPFSLLYNIPRQSHLRAEVWGFCQCFPL